MAACGMEVAGLEVEADIPATTMPRDCREQNPRPRRANPAIGADIAGLARAQQSSQLPSVVVHPDLADGRQSNRPGMAFADPDQATAMLMPLVAYPEALAAATFAFVLREANPRALACAAPGISKCGKRPTAVNRGFLKHLCRDPTPPGQPGHLLVDDPLGATTNSRPASSLIFHLLNALIRSNPDHGTLTCGSICLASRALLTRSRHWF